MNKVVLSSKEVELLNAFFHSSGASLTSFACGDVQYNTAIGVLRKLGI